MRIAVISIDFRPGLGGVQNYLYEIGQRLGASHQVIAVTPQAGPLPQGSTIEKFVLKRGQVVHFWSALRALKPDLVLVGHAHPQLLLAAMLYRPSRFTAIAYGNDYLAAQQRWHRPLFNWLLRQAHPLLTVSAASAGRLEQRGLPTPAVIRPGVDPQRFHPISRAAREPQVLITVSRLVPRKGIDTVLKGLAILRSKFPHLKYNIVGDGPDRGRLENLRDSLRLGSTVTFCGSVSDGDLPEYYREADIFAMPAREEHGSASVEGFGMVYLEASASGLPIIAARSGGASEAVKDGQTGLLVPPDDAEAFSHALKQLLEDEQLRRQLGARGRQWVETTMNWDRAAQEMESLLAAVR